MTDIADNILAALPIALITRCSHTIHTSSWGGSGNVATSASTARVHWLLPAGRRKPTACCLSCWDGGGPISQTLRSTQICSSLETGLGFDSWDYHSHSLKIRTGPQGQLSLRNWSCIFVLYSQLFVQGIGHETSSTFYERLNVVLVVLLID